MDDLKAVFIDRDGTLNEDPEGYINRPDSFKLFPHAADSIRRLNVSGYRIFVITNQSGIARGYFSVEDLAKVHTEMNDQLSRGKAMVDEIFVSPYHSEGTVEPYNRDHEDRKPGLGLFHKAKNRYNIDLKKSYMIGDKYSDIEFGKKAGLKTILVQTGYGKAEFMNNRANWKFKPDLIVKDLGVAVNFILKLGDRI